MGSSVNHEPSTVNGFRDLIDQTRAIRLLQQGLKSGRTAHAYLFTGPEGIGKRAAALALAQALNCQQGDAVEDGCGVCLSCRKIARGLHPDVQVIEPAGPTLKIEQVRALGADAALGPYEGKRKVFVVDGAEKMTEQAANALLKTLEEPPGRAVLVLLSTTPSALPLTIVSRCQVVIFSAISPERLRAYLVDKGVDQTRARLIAAFSGGSIGRALSPEMASLAASRDLFLEELGRGLRDGPAAIIELAEKQAKDREGLRHNLESLSAWFRDLMVSKVSRRQEWLVNQDRGEEIARQAEGLSLGAILDGLRAVHAAMDGLTRNANPRLSLEHLLLRLREAVSSGLLQVSA
ncbi:MAG: DNA polymerase III subunit delta' [Candidatus Methylomirabilis sp.]